MQHDTNSLNDGNPGGFDHASTAEEVVAGLDLTGRNIVVTGVSAGIGVETARVLVARGARVIAGVRDLRKAREATAHFPTDAGRLDFVELDLASLASVRACADAIAAMDAPIDVVIANAAIMACPFMRTVDGFEMQFGTNHLGHFLLVNRLRPLMRGEARVVMVSSAGHRFSDVDLDDPNFERREYSEWPAYGQSKTANSLFAVEFDRRNRDAGIRAAALHPGVIQTELVRHLPQDLREQAAASARAAAATPNDANAEMQHKTVGQGAATSVWAALRAPGELIGGKFCENCAVAPIREDDSQGRRGVRPYALDPERAKALWTLSEELVGERF